MSLAQSVIAQPPFRFYDTWPYVTFENFDRLFSDYVVSPRLSHLAPQCADCNRTLPASRLSDGPGDSARQGRLAQYPAAPRHPAVLDFVPAARLCLDRHDGKQQLVQPGAYLTTINAFLPAASGNQFRPDDEFEFRRDSCRGLFLSALHDPAALRQSGKTRLTR